MRSASLALLLFTAATVQGQPSAAPDTVDRLVAAEMAKNHVPGIAIAIVRDGRVVRTKGYGFADIEARVPVTEQTVFKIGSLSKQIIAGGVALLAQEGRLRYEDPVNRFYSGVPAHWQGITLRHFLTHTSGVRREGPAFTPMQQVPDSIVVQSAFSPPLEFPTGSKYQYCNVCYFALADIISRVSGKPWNVFIAERIFLPLGMRSTTTTAEATGPGVARGYVWSNDRWTPAPDWPAVRPSGAFSSTVLDLVRWASALESDTPFRAQTRELMWTPAPLTDGKASGYGFGWTIDSLDARPRLRHGGSLPGFRAEISRLPAERLTVIVLTNGDNAAPARLAAEITRAVSLRVRKDGP